MPTIVKDLKTSKKIVTQKSVRVFIKRATYERLNHRRYELVAKKNREGLNKEEHELFIVLQEEVRRLVNLAYPRESTISDELLDKLEEMVRKRDGD